MKIVETITPDNADKVIMGEKDVKITYDTETGKVALNTPAIWGGDAKMDMSKLRTVLDQLEASTTSVREETQDGELLPVKNLKVDELFAYNDRFFKVVTNDDNVVHVISIDGQFEEDFWHPNQAMPSVDAKTWFEKVRVLKA